MGDKYLTSYSGDRLIRMFLLVSLLVSLCWVDTVAYERKLLVEIFTSTLCPICPRHIPPVQDALEEEFEDLIFIQYHTWWVGDDPWYLENYERQFPEQDDMRTRIFWMGYDHRLGVPSFFYDGHRIDYHAGNIVENSINYVSDRIDEESPLQIEVEALADGDDLLTTVTINSEENLTNLTLFLALCEREVEYNAPSGQNRFTGNVLDLYPDGEGYRFSIVRNYEMVYETESSLDVGWRDNELDNLKVVVWVQRQDLEILQSESVGIVRLIAPEEDLIMPVGILLGKPYPNPFNSHVKIPYSIKHTGQALLTIHDLSGHEVARPVDGEITAGKRSISFDAEKAGITNGVYYVKLVSDGRIETQKIIYLR